MLVGLTLLASLAIGAWWYVNRRELSRQWACYRVGAAESFSQAQHEIAWFETGPDRRDRLRDLTRKWGTGNRQFDLYLARHVDDLASSELLRETFSRELGRRKELLPRWARYWSHRAKLEPDRQIASTLSYLDTLVLARVTRTIPWREVLDLQAVFQLTGHGHLAADLSPENWQQQYRRWQQTRPARLSHTERPGKPFAD